MTLNLRMCDKILNENAHKKALPMAPKRLTVATSKGGVAKSTTVRNLAAAAAAEGKRVACVDFDTQRSLSEFFDRRPDEARQIDIFTATMPEVQLLHKITDYDVVMIDTPPLTTENGDVDQVRNSERMKHTLSLLQLSDFVLVPTLQQLDDIASTEKWLFMLRQLTIKSATLLSATNRRSTSFEIARRQLTRLGNVCPIDIPRYEDIPAAAERGLGACEVKRAKGAEDFKAVWSYLKIQLEIA